MYSRLHVCDACVEGSEIWDPAQTRQTWRLVGATRWCAVSSDRSMRRTVVSSCRFLAHLSTPEPLMHPPGGQSDGHPRRQDAGVLRPAVAADADGIAAVLTSARAAQTFISPLHTPSDDHGFLTERMLAANEVWVVDHVGRSLASWPRSARAPLRRAAGAA
jgi:hypothetical protein